MVRGQRTEDRGQRTEDRGQRAEGRRQKAEGRRQKAEGRRQKAEGRRQKAEGNQQLTLALTFEKSFNKMNIKIDNINVNYEIAGKGNPVLLLHGWGGDISSFKPLQEFLQKKHKVYVLDFPGFGKSDIPKSPWDAGNYSAFLAKFMKQISLNKADIIAHSFGGRVAIKLAVEQQGMINKLILVDSAGIIPRRTYKYYFKTSLAKTGKIAVKFLGNFGSKIKDKIYQHIGSKDFRNAGPMRGTFVKVIKEDLEPFLKNIMAPTLLIWGGNDRETPIYMAKIMEREIKDAGLVVLQNAGHFSYLDQFQHFSVIVNNFLQPRS